MSRTDWNLSHLKSELSNRANIKAWIISEEHVHRRERYFMAEGGRLVVDQDRNVHGRTVTVRIFVFLPTAGRQGEITKKLFSALPLKNQIDQAVEAALQTDHQAWELPTKLTAPLPTLSTADPKMAEDLDRVMLQLTDRIQKTVKKARDTRFDSSELFLSIHHRELHLSNGLQHRWSQSRIYNEAAFSYSHKDDAGRWQSDEYLSTQWAVHLDRLPLEKLFEETSERARHSLKVVKPETGKYSVVIDSEVLATLLQDHLSQLSAGNAYHNLPFIDLGQEFIPQANGDLLSITLDPTLEYGAMTTAISDQGLLQSPLPLVRANRVLNTATDKQYGDYLGRTPNTVRGNVVVAGGQLSHAELTQQAPQVLEILQFSGLFTDPNSGTFSSEIRLARLYDNQRDTVKYIKGGSLSGSISENFRGLKLSKDLVHRAHFSSESSIGQGYYGPDYALLTEVSIVG